MEDEIVELVVAMQDPHASCALVGQALLVPRNELAPTGDFPHRLSRIDVFNRGLGECDLGKGLDLTREVWLVRAKVLQANVLRVERGVRTQRAHRREPAVDNRSLCECGRGKGLDLTREVQLVRAKVLQADVLRVEQGERAQCAHRIEPAVDLREDGNSLRRAGEWDDSRKEERPR